MKNAIRNGALALGLIAGAALIAIPPVEAKSIQRDGYFGGTWGPIGPRNNRYVKRYHRYGPSYYSYYGPRRGYYDYDYGPRYYGPGISFGFAFD